MVLTPNNVAQNMGQCQALINTVINLGSHRGGEFLDQPGRPLGHQEGLFLAFSKLTQGRLRQSVSWSCKTQPSDAGLK